MLRAEERERKDLGGLLGLSVASRVNAPPVSLGQVADLKVENVYGRIARESLQRTLTVEARSLRTTAQDLAPRVQPKLDELRETLPPGHAVRLAGVIEESSEGQAALATNFPLSLGLMIVLFVAQFGDYRRPAIVVLTIPLILIGAVTGLFILQADFGFMVILGLLSLAGIIVNNALVLIDRIDLERRDGADFDSAVISACVRRFRPILMTTITTILGFMPLIVFRDALFYPMASAMAVGLLVGTVLTLGVIPVLYTWLIPREA